MPVFPWDKHPGQKNKQKFWNCYKIKPTLNSSVWYRVQYLKTLSSLPGHQWSPGWAQLWHTLSLWCWGRQDGVMVTYTILPTDCSTNSHWRWQSCFTKGLRDQDTATTSTPAGTKVHQISLGCSSWCPRQPPGHTHFGAFTPNQTCMASPSAEVRPMRDSLEKHTPDPHRNPGLETPNLGRHIFYTIELKLF